MDPVYQELLDVLRYFKPTPRTLRELERRVFCNDEPSDLQLLNVLTTHPDAMILTVSRAAANRVNKVAFVNLFEQSTESDSICYDDEHGIQPEYRDMKVVITHNRNKELCVVNGESATVVTMHIATVFLRLPNESIVAIYAVTQLVDRIKQTKYPFVPAYASTICKVQGQNLGRVIVWLDCCAIPEGAAYVSLSRTRKLFDLYFTTKTVPEQYKPIVHSAQ